MSITVDFPAPVRDWILQNLTRGVDAQALVKELVGHQSAPEVAAARRAGARAPDRLESEDIAFFERVRAGYADRAAAAPARFARIDASHSLQTVREAVLATALARAGSVTATGQEGDARC